MVQRTLEHLARRVPGKHVAQRAHQRIGGRTDLERGPRAGHAFDDVGRRVIGKRAVDRNGTFRVAGPVADLRRKRQLQFGHRRCGLADGVDCARGMDARQPCLGVGACRPERERQRPGSGWMHQRAGAKVEGEQRAQDQRGVVIVDALLVAVAIT